MKILLSAYACEPGKGSEPGVGWHWALELARRGHEVWVLTRANNRPSIEPALARMPEAPNLRFLYYDLPSWARWWKKGSRGVHLYYLLWQWGAYRRARTVHARERFDRVHHVTFVGVRQPSFMGNLGIPFTFGPVAGGERAPWRLRFGYGPRGWVADAFRDLGNALVRFDPLMRRTFRQAERIYVTSEQTLGLLPRRYQARATIQLAIGYDSDIANRDPPAKDDDPERNAEFRVLYVGRLLYWKGMHLGFLAFARAAASRSSARLTLAGEGPEEQRWKRLARDLRIADRTEWVPWLERERLQALYRSHDVLLFPSLRDSGGMAVLEAMGHGLPVVCLDLGGPGAMVDATCGRVIATGGRSEDEVVEALGDALIKLADDETLRARLAEGAIRRARDFVWTATVSSIYRPLMERPPFRIIGGRP